MSAWVTVVTEEPTGEVPRMLVPVTVTCSTFCAGAVWAAAPCIQKAANAMVAVAK